MTTDEKLDEVLAQQAKILTALQHLQDGVLALWANAEQDRARLFKAHDELGGRVTRLERVIKPKPVRARKAADRG
jgi:hypothetical protein